ncbi:MAG: hypothetical protein HZC42_08350 [Candidatus Eisenbacteria bacterium]|nr:hypothetical protein [Candidatus Eisenbacteria bacterium]
MSAVTAALSPPGRVRLRAALASLALALLAGCAWIPFLQVSRFDPVTEQNLADLKPVVSEAYAGFAQDAPDTTALASVRWRLDDALAHERAKGEANRRTTRQLELILATFDRDVASRGGGPPWSPAAVANARENLEEAFDIALRTERGKRR